MAQARQFAADGQPAPFEPWNPFGRWVSVPAPMRAAAAAVLILGLAAGAFMARGTFQPPASESVASTQSADAHVAAVYSLDYLTDAPSGSLAHVYVTLVSAQNGGRN